MRRTKSSPRTRSSALGPPDAARRPATIRIADERDQAATVAAAATTRRSAHAVTTVRGSRRRRLRRSTLSRRAHRQCAARDSSDVAACDDRTSGRDPDVPASGRETGAPGAVVHSSPERPGRTHRREAQRNGAFRAFTAFGPEVTAGISSSGPVRISASSAPAGNSSSPAPIGGTASREPIGGGAPWGPDAHGAASTRERLGLVSGEQASATPTARSSDSWTVPDRWVLMASSARGGRQNIGTWISGPAAATRDVPGRCVSCPSFRVVAPAPAVAARRLGLDFASRLLGDAAATAFGPSASTAWAAGPPFPAPSAGSVASSPSVAGAASDPSCCWVTISRAEGSVASVPPTRFGPSTVVGSLTELGRMGCGSAWLRRTMSRVPSLLVVRPVVVVICTGCPFSLLSARGGCRDEWGPGTTSDGQG